MITALNKDTNEVWGFDDGTSLDTMSMAFQSDKMGRPFNDVNPSTYETLILPAMKEAKATGNNQILYDARRKQSETDAFSGALAAGPFGLFKNNNPEIQEELQQNRAQSPVAAFAGDLTQQTFDFLTLGKVAEPLIAPIASRLGFAALGATPLEVRLAKIGSGEILQKTAGQVINDVASGVASNSMIGALYNGITSSVDEGKKFFDGTDEAIGKKFPDFAKVGMDTLKGLSFGVFGIGGAFTRTPVGISLGSATVGGAMRAISKAEGATDTDANLNGFMGMIFHAVGTTQFSIAERRAILNSVPDAIGEYTGEKNPATKVNNVNQLAGDEFSYSIARETLRQKYMAQLQEFNASQMDVNLKQQEGLVSHAKDIEELQRQLENLDNEGGPALLDKIAQSDVDTHNFVRSIADQIFQVNKVEGKGQVDKTVPKTETAVPAQDGVEIGNQNVEDLNKQIAKAKGEGKAVMIDLPAKENLSHQEAIDSLGVDNTGKPVNDSRFSVASSSGKLGQGKGQTGFEGIKTRVVDYIKAFADKHDLRLTITAGTEESGHNPKLEFNHKNGDKIDLRNLEKNAKTPVEKKDIAKLNALVESWGATETRPEIDNAVGYKDPNSNTIFWKEGNHWDVEVRPVETGKNSSTKAKVEQKQTGKADTSTGETKTSGIAKSIEAKAIEDGLISKGVDKLAGYDSSTIKEQAKIFTDTVNNRGVDGLRAIIRGEKPLPEGAKGFPFTVAIEEYLRTADIPKNIKEDIVHELITSDLASSGSEAASELGLGQNRSQDSVIAKSREIIKAKIEKLGGKAKVEKVMKEKLKKLKEATDGINLTEKELGTLDDFFREIGC